VLSIRLFGAPEITLDGQPLTLSRRKSRALVYYLAAHAQPLTRDHLLAFFWPDADRPSAQQTLRTTLHGLRKALGAALIVEDVTLALASDAEVDVRQFEANLQSPIPNLQFLTSTLGLYRGDFLAGFTLPDTPVFDDWAASQREYYRRLAARGLTALSRQHEAAQNFTAALDALDRALAFDPLQEDLQRAALRLLYLSGDRAGAVRRYEALRKLLDDEMGVPPMAETRALYDAIITDALPRSVNLEVGRQKLEVGSRKSEVGIVASDLQPPTSTLQPSTPFAGRAAELGVLRSLPSDKLALLEGEPGLGKTRLAEEFIRESGGIALVGAARELENALPYQPVIEALRDLLARPDWPALRVGLEADLAPLWLAELARLLPELAAGPGSAAPAASVDESRVWEGVYQLLLALARRQRVIVFLDDLHWADASTLALLGYLIRRVPAGTAPLVFVGAARALTPRSPLAALAQTLTREGRLARLPLARLARDEMAALVTQVCAAQSEPLLNWLAFASEGNPYILVELLRYAREHDVLRADGTVNVAALSSSPIVPQSVYTLIQARLARLSDAARRVLDAAVAVGREFEFEVAARAAALSEAAALDALDELRASGLIRALDGQRFAFDHSLTMEVAYREVGEPRHRLLHRRVAEALESVYRNRLDAVAGLLAQHFSEGNEPERAAPYALRAGQRAAQMAAWKEASAFYELALEGESDEARRGAIFRALGEVHTQAGQFARAAEALRAAIAVGETRPEAVDVKAARLALGQALFAQARYSEAIDLAQSLLAGTQDRPAASDVAGAAEALWGTALSMEGADLAGAAEHLQKAAALLRGEERLADSPRLGQIIFELGNVAAQQGDLRRAAALYEEALAVAESTAGDFSIPLQILGHNNLAYHLHLLGDMAPAIEHAQAGLRLAQDRGVLGLQTYLLSTLGEIALAQDDLGSAEARFTEGLALAEQLSIPERIAGLSANLGRLAARRGQTALAIHHLSGALARADTLGTRHLAAQIRLWLVPLLPPAEARAALAEARVIAESGGRRRLLEEAARLEAEIGS
jgi:DNA-binding SARP family transcriptional activator